MDQPWTMEEHATVWRTIEVRGQDECSPIHYGPQGQITRVSANICPFPNVLLVSFLQDIGQILALLLYALICIVGLIKISSGGSVFYLNRVGFSLIFINSPMNLIDFYSYFLEN